MAKNQEQTEDTRKLTGGQDKGHTEEAGSFAENPNKGVVSPRAGEGDPDAEDYARKVLGEDHDGPTQQQRDQAKQAQTETARTPEGEAGKAAAREQREKEQERNQ